MTTELLEAAEPSTGVTCGLPKKLRIFADSAHAMFYLGVAHAVLLVHESDHPDLAELQNRGVTITGAGFDRWEASIDLVAEEYSRDQLMDFDAARGTIHDAWTKGTQQKILWQAVADGRVSRYQARTIENHAERLTARTATLTETPNADGSIELTADEGDRLLDGEHYLTALQDYLQTAVTHAENGLTARKLATKCSQKVRQLTPGYELVKLDKPDDKPGLIVTPCEDNLTAHVAWIAPLDLALRLHAHTNAAADHAADAAKHAGVVDERSHGQRVSDVLTDLLTDSMKRAVPALTDPTEAATHDSPAVRGRTHRPATSVQVHVRMNATTALGLDDDEATVDGYGPIPAHVARQLATSAGAMWRKIVLDPGTRDVIDVGAHAYEITAAMRRFITDRDEYCQAPGCQVPAINCDLDHTIPYPEGPTTAANLRAYCRGHHRYKTQYVYEATHAHHDRIAARHPKPPPPDDDPPPF